MKILYFIIFTISIYCSAQTNNTIHEFDFYHNGNYKNSKKINFLIVKDSDSITCNISNRKISIPKISAPCSIIVYYRKKSYKINNIDFSRLDNESKIVFGIEKNLKNFSPVRTIPNAYLLDNYKLAVKVKNIKQAKKVNFIVFNSSKTQSNGKISYKNYSYSETLND